VGGAGGDWAVGVTGSILVAEGSFETVTGVSSECSVPCPGGTCPANPVCTPLDLRNDYSVQLNTKPFTTAACRSSPTPATCQGWQQFIYTPAENGNAYIQYWLVDYGPAGTQCPLPRSANCQPGDVSSDGWCPFPDSSGGVSTVDCGRNAVNSAPAPIEAITSLSQLSVWAEAAGGFGEATDQVIVTVDGVPYGTYGNNIFPDLRSQWQVAEFNVFGGGDYARAILNPGSTLVVRTKIMVQNAVGGGTTTSPTLVPQTFTGESNNLTLANPPCPIVGSSPAIVFTETNASPAPKPFCACPATATWDPSAASCKCNTAGQVIINGKCAVPPPPLPQKNACGGTTPLHDVLNAPCGTSCGRWTCDGLNALMCKTYTNACGGCSPLPISPGEGLQPGEPCTCSNGTGGHYACTGKVLACDCQP